MYPSSAHREYGSGERRSCPRLLKGQRSHRIGVDSLMERTELRKELQRIISKIFDEKQTRNEKETEN